MNEDPSSARYLRILLRRPDTGMYLQSSGEWGAERNSARDFDSSLLAYDWAKQNGLLGSAVLMAVGPEQNDTVLARVQKP